MEAMILLGRGKQILDMPEVTWKGHLAHVPQHGQSRLSFMTGAHHRVRYFVVEKLVDIQKPIEPDFIAKSLNLSTAQVTGILEELEQKLFFLVRDNQGAVVWAYPMTVEPTPHKLHFNTGEKLYGA